MRRLLPAAAVGPLLLVLGACSSGPHTPVAVTTSTTSTTSSTTTTVAGSVGTWSKVNLADGADLSTVS